MTKPLKPGLCLALNPNLLSPAPTTLSGAAACAACGRKPDAFDYAPGTFEREGIVLTCAKCGHRGREPTATTLHRHEVELAELRWQMAMFRKALFGEVAADAATADAAEQQGPSGAGHG